MGLFGITMELTNLHCFPSMAISLLLASLTLTPLISAQVVSTITVAPAIPSDEPSYSSFQSFTSAILNSTNTYREQHNASSVSWNKTLENFAQDYLDDMKSDSCEFEHSGGPYGENLAMGYKNSTAAVEAWGDEREEYDFGDQGFREKTGHFTQLVWKNTTDVGCARKLCNERGWYLVCEYWPRGNVQGQYDEQVQNEEGLAVGVSRPGVSTILLAALFCVIWGV